MRKMFLVTFKTPERRHQDFADFDQELLVIYCKSLKSFCPHKNYRPEDY